LGPRASILQVNNFPPATEARLSRLFAVERWPAATADRDLLLQRCGSAIRGIATSSLGPVDAPLIQSLPALEIIACFSVGLDGIDSACARSRNIKVTSSGTVVASDVADVVIGLMLSLGRGMPRADRFVREGKWRVEKGQWSNGNYPLGHSMKDRHVGLLGFGRIGQAVAQRLAGFPVQVGYCARSERPETACSYFANILDLAAWSDVLVVCCPGGAATRHLVDAAVLRNLGSTGLLINVARGSVVDEAALVDALEAGTIGGAGLDVFEAEPAVSEALRARPDVILLPHIGSATEETRLAMGDSMIDALLGQLMPAGD
jgi:lactate dehydrogenase-like 2-hydroxyacid dehydrogenase